MLYNFTVSWRWGDTLKQKERKVRMTIELELDERFTSYIEGMVYRLGFAPKTLRDYADLLPKLLRKALSAGARVASWDPKHVEGVAASFLEPALEVVKWDDLKNYQLVNIFEACHLLLLILGLVYDFFEDKRVKRVDELTAEFEEFSSELMYESKKDPYAVVRPDLARRAPAILREIWSLIGQSDEEAAELHG
jgi:hypothetical protein